MTSEINHPMPRPNELAWTHPLNPDLPAGKTKAEERLIAKVVKAMNAAFGEAVQGLHGANAIAFKVGSGLVVPNFFAFEAPSRGPSVLTATFMARGYLVARAKKADARFHKKG